MIVWSQTAKELISLFWLKNIIGEFFSDKAVLDSKQWSAFITAGKLSMRSRLKPNKSLFIA